MQSEEIPIQFKACGTCPFRKNPKVIGSREYLKDVFSLIFHGRLNHSCHRTDKDADGYVGGEKKQCLGILRIKYICCTSSKTEVELYHFSAVVS